MGRASDVSEALLLWFYFSKAGGVNWLLEVAWIVWVR